MKRTLKIIPLVVAILLMTACSPVSAFAETANIVPEVHENGQLVTDYGCYGTDGRWYSYDANGNWFGYDANGNWQNQPGYNPYAATGNATFVNSGYEFQDSAENALKVPPLTANAELNWYNDYYGFIYAGNLNGHWDFSGSGCTNKYHAPDCLHRRLWNLIAQKEDDWSFQQLNSLLYSGDWARRGLYSLMTKLAESPWELENFTIHEKTANGWTELRLRHKCTGATLDCVMNAYTSNASDADDGCRRFAFTWKHLDNKVLRNYDESLRITELALAMEQATSDFVSWLSKQ